jgi:hypothetical protein
MDRLSSCPLTIHALLHIADSIKAVGPVWCYWAFPMERYCGTLQRSIHSRRFPFASLDRFITETAQLRQIVILYDVADVLALRAPPSCGNVLAVPNCMFIQLRVLEVATHSFCCSKIHPVYYCCRDPKLGPQNIFLPVLLRRLQLGLI